MVLDIREMIQNGDTPPPTNDARCQHCSLAESCLPSVVGEPHKIRSARDSLFKLDED